ncbi:energy transducer TonB, partial [Bradyrhizobium sp. BRP22]|nr:energy transducer TonB [Bradyrhizobium sp. BRP22]
MSRLRDDWKLPDEPQASTSARRSSVFRSPGLRYGAALAVIALLFGGAGYWLLGGNDLPPPRQVREITIVNITPP